MSTWHQRLRNALKDKGWSVAKLARETDIPYDRVIKWVNGGVKNPRGDNTLEVLAKALGVERDWLLTGRDFSGLDVVEVYQVPRIALGELESVTTQQIADWDGEWQTAPKGTGTSAVSVSVEDDAMEPKLQSGDEVIVDLGLTAKPDNIVAVVLPENQRPVFRRYQVPEITSSGSGTVVFAANNKSYTSYRLELDLGYRIIGVVTHRITRLT